MLEKTNAIVVKTTKYSETSLIIKAFTEAFGMRTYMIKGVRKRKSKTPMSLFQPFSLLEMVVYEKPGRNMQNVKEVKAFHHFKSIPYDIRKSSIAMFLDEVVLKSIGEEEKNQELFSFLLQSILFLDETVSDYQNFHLWFLTHLTRYLGFKTSADYQDNKTTFDMQEGRFTSLVLPDTISIQAPLSYLFYQLQTDENFAIGLKMSRKERQFLIEKLLNYYQFHLPEFPEVKSLAVLEEVMN